LEAIFPRFLVLKEVVRLVEETSYKEAFRLVRQHKVDINIIYDVDPEKFEANIGKFVAELESVDFLNLFINSLNDKDRGKELEFYRPLYEEDRIVKEHREVMDSEYLDGVKKSGKVNRICDLIRERLVEKNQ